MVLVTVADIEGKEGLSLETGQSKALLTPPWLTRRFVIWTLVSVLTVGPIPAALLLTVGDQWLRNHVDDWMSGPDLFKTLSIRPDQYRELPLRWRQALAEAVVRDPTEAAGLQELIKTLTVEHIGLLDQIAPYAIGGFVKGSYIVRDKENPSRHPISGLSVKDFALIEDLGVLQSVERGHLLQIADNIFGTTVVLEVQLDDPDQKPNLNITSFTERGEKLIRLVRAPSNIAYFEWVARKIEESVNGNVRVNMWAIGTHEPGNVGGPLRDLGRIIDRNTTPLLPEGGGN